LIEHFTNWSTPEVIHPSPVVLTPCRFVVVVVVVVVVVAVVVFL